MNILDRSTTFKMKVVFYGEVQASNGVKFSLPDVYKGKRVRITMNENEVRIVESPSGNKVSSTTFANGTKVNAVTIAPSKLGLKKDMRPFQKMSTHVTLRYNGTSGVAPSPLLELKAHIEKEKREKDAQMGVPLHEAYPHQIVNPYPWRQRSDTPYISDVLNGRTPEAAKELERLIAAERQAKERMDAQNSDSVRNAIAQINRYLMLNPDARAVIHPDGTLGLQITHVTDISG